MIILHNVRKCYHYPLVRVCGRVQRSSSSNSSSRRSTSPSVIEDDKQLVLVVRSASSELSRWTLCGQRFVILLHLTRRGENVFRLSIQTLDRHSETIEPSEEHKNVDQVTVRIEYRPLVRSKFVRLIYVTCQDRKENNNADGNGIFDEGRFEAPRHEDDSPASACSRLGIGALMMQTFFAETLGLKRSCLQLELDETIQLPVVHTLVLSLTYKQIWSMDSEQLWRVVGQHLVDAGDDLYDANCKYLAMCSFSRYFPDANVVEQHDPSKLVRGYVSLGGDGLALLSSHCLYTWPQTVAEIATRLVASDNEHDDRQSTSSLDSGRYWSAATFTGSLGACLHEMCHNLSLGHSINSEGIMGLGFQEIVQQFFTLTRRHSRPRLSRWWSPAEMAILQVSPWLAATSSKSYSADPNTKANPIEVDTTKGCVRSRHGLRVVEYRSPDTNQVMYSEIFNLPTRWYRLRRPPPTSSSSTTTTSSTRFLFFAIDIVGNVFNETICI